VTLWNGRHVGKAIYFDYGVENLSRRFFTVQLSKKWKAIVFQAMNAFIVFLLACRLRALKQ
jgi:hypothetical protein